MKDEKEEKIRKDQGIEILELDPTVFFSQTEEEKAKEFVEMRKELDTLYGKAVSEQDYLRVMEKARKLKNRMWREHKSNYEIAEAIYNGLFGNYYLVRKFAHTSENISDIKTNVETWYEYIDEKENLSLKIKYGYLLAVILSELADDFAGADRIRNEIREIAEKSGDVLSIFRLINADGLNEMKIGLYKQAIKTFGTIEDYGEIHPDAFRNAGNIYSNRGAANIRGGIDALAGAQDLLRAANYYLQEDEPPRKHLQGVMNRFREAIEDLAEEVGRGDSLVSLSRGENL